MTFDPGSIRRAEVWVCLSMLNDMRSKLLISAPTTRSRAGTRPGEARRRANTGMGGNRLTVLNVEVDLVIEDMNHPYTILAIALCAISMHHILQSVSTPSRSGWFIA